MKQNIIFSVSIYTSISACFLLSVLFILLLHVKPHCMVVSVWGAAPEKFDIFFEHRIFLLCNIILFFSTWNSFLCNINFFLLTWNTFSCGINLFLLTPDYFLCNIKLFVSTQNCFLCNTKFLFWTLFRMLCHGDMFFLSCSNKNLIAFQ